MSLINPKCAAITAGGILLYYTYPTRDSPNHLLWAALLAGGIYTSIAWYDTLYDCDEKTLASSWFTLYRPVKPPVDPVSGRYGERSSPASAAFAPPCPAT